MLILSFGQPIKTQEIRAGKGRIINIGQMSTRTINMILEIFGVKFWDEGEGVCKSVRRVT